MKNIPFCTLITFLFPVDVFAQVDLNVAVSSNINTNGLLERAIPSE
jgi:hypothetical protein